MLRLRSNTSSSLLALRRRMRGTSSVSAMPTSATAATIIPFSITATRQFVYHTNNTNFMTRNPDATNPKNEGAGVLLVPTNRAARRWVQSKQQDGGNPPPTARTEENTRREEYQEGPTYVRYYYAYRPVPSPAFYALLFLSTFLFALFFPGFLFLPLIFFGGPFGMLFFLFFVLPFFLTWMLFGHRHEYQRYHSYSLPPPPHFGGPYVMTPWGWRPVYVAWDRTPYDEKSTSTSQEEGNNNSDEEKKNNTKVPITGSN